MGPEPQSLHPFPDVVDLVLGDALPCDDDHDCDSWARGPGASTRTGGMKKGPRIRSGALGGRGSVLDVNLQGHDGTGLPPGEHTNKTDTTRAHAYSWP